MTRRTGYFYFESIVVAATAILTIMTLSILGHAVLNPVVFA